MCEWLNDMHVEDEDMVFTCAALKAVLAHLYIALGTHSVMATAGQLDSSNSS